MSTAIMIGTGLSARPLEGEVSAGMTPCEGRYRFLDTSERNLAEIAGIGIGGYAEYREVSRARAKDLFPWRRRFAGPRDLMALAVGMQPGGTGLRQPSITANGTDPRHARLEAEVARLLRVLERNPWGARCAGRLATPHVDVILERLGDVYRVLKETVTIPTDTACSTLIARAQLASEVKHET